MGKGESVGPTMHWVGLVGATLLILPVPVALLAGWTPLWLRNRQAGLRLRAYGILCYYALAPLNLIPRLARAPHEVIMACTGLGFAAIIGGVVLFLLAEREETRAAQAARAPVASEPQGS
jgi:hypothetical protein